MADVLTSGSYVFQNQFFLEHFDSMFLDVATEWLSSFRSYGFMERGENTLAVTGLRHWGSSRMPAPGLLSGRFLLRDLCRTALRLLSQSLILPLCFI
jgi:hypothetical protein